MECPTQGYIRLIDQREETIAMGSSLQLKPGENGFPPRPSVCASVRQCLSVCSAVPPKISRRFFAIHKRHSTITLKRKNVLAVCSIFLFLWSVHTWKYSTSEADVAVLQRDAMLVARDEWEASISPDSIDTIQMVDDSIIMIPEMTQLQQMATPRLAEMYQRNINNLQIFCPVKDVFGGTHNGWAVCSTAQLNPCVVYLITTNPGQSDFLDEIKSRWGCQVHKIAEKDCTDKSLNRIKQEEVIDIFAIDVDGSEVFLLNHMLTMGLTEKIKQLQVTFHSDAEGRLNNKEYMDRLAVHRQLLHDGFRTYHHTRNSQCTHCDAPHRPGCATLNMMRPSHVKAPIVLPTDHALRNLTSNKLHWMYHRFLQTTQTFCKKLIPAGNVGRGTWEVCDDQPYSPALPCLVYSFGTADDWAFDSEMANKFGCEVHSFDPRYQNTIPDDQDKTGDLKTMTSDLVPGHAGAGTVFYHHVALWDKDTELRRPDGQTWTANTLSTIKKKLRHLKRQLDVLRIDIDSSEWTVLPSLVISGTLRHVKQLFLELHGDSDDGGEVYRHRLSVLRQLHDIGFRSFWAQPNPESQNQFKSSVTGTQVTKVYQLNLINIYVP